MPLNFSAAHSSRITKKPRDVRAVLKRSSSAPFAHFKRAKPAQRSLSQVKVSDEEDFFEDRLDDRGLVESLASDPSLRDVPQSIRYIRSYMFDPIPEKGGMNSTRIAEILNFRKSLPQMITVSHVHALIRSPTVVEREVAELAKAAVLRKTVIPGRGVGGSSVSDGLVLLSDLESLLREASGLEETLKGLLYIVYIATFADQALSERFRQCLQDHPTGLTLPIEQFSNSDLSALMRAGFLTSSSTSLTSANAFASSHAASSGTLTSLDNISRAASGSMAAVGGDGAIHGAGNTGKESIVVSHTTEQISHSITNRHNFQLALPNTGPYLKLLVAARSHLMSLLVKTRYRELPIYLLHERWNGGIASEDNAATQAKKYRGEFTGVLPGRTRKWKQFYGLSFQWVLAECLGGGLIEVFETGSVGRAVRAI